MEQAKLERAIQRYQAYQLLSKIYAKGLTPSVIAIANDIPSLQPLLPKTFDADLLSAEHQDLLGFNVLPYAGVYLSEDGRLGGEIDRQLKSWYHTFGFEAESTKTAPDHISNQLAFLSFLSVPEIESYKESGNSETARDYQLKQAEFLKSQLMQWVLPFFIAVKAQGHAFYAEVADLTQALLIDHLQEIQVDVDASFPLPSPPDLLGNPKTGIKQIALFLLKPVYSGVYFSKNDINAIAGGIRIPTGFGDRGQILNNTFQSAISYDQLPLLLENLSEWTLKFKHHYESLRQYNVSFLDQLLDQWIDRVDNTRNILNLIKQEGLAPH